MIYLLITFGTIILYLIGATVTFRIFAKKYFVININNYIDKSGIKDYEMENWFPKQINNINDYKQFIQGCKKYDEFFSQLRRYAKTDFMPNINIYIVRIYSVLWPITAICAIVYYVFMYTIYTFSRGFDFMLKIALFERKQKPPKQIVLGESNNYRLPANKKYVSS